MKRTSSTTPVFKPADTIGENDAFTKALAHLVDRAIEAERIPEESPLYASADAAQDAAWLAVIATANSYAAHVASWRTQNGGG